MALLVGTHKIDDREAAFFQIFQGGENTRIILETLRDASLTGPIKSSDIYHVRNALQNYKNMVLSVRDTPGLVEYIRNHPKIARQAYEVRNELATLLPLMQNAVDFIETQIPAATEQNDPSFTTAQAAPVRAGIANILAVMQKV